MTDSRDIVEKARRRALTREPPYGNNLRKVFPWWKTASRENVDHWVDCLTNEMVDIEARELEYGSSIGAGPPNVGPWFAVTGSLFRQDGAVTLWLSIDAVRFLHGEGLISEVEE